MESPVFAAGLAGGTRDLHAPSGWGGSRYSGARVAAPFAVLDTVYQAMAKVRSVAPKTAFPPLNLYWSTENIAVSGSVALGQIGTTSFAMGGGAGPRIFVLGKENSDTDEYDASVIAHEWGHYYQNAFSRDDSPGGPHAFNDRLDRRLAFSEGWGNAWSGMALERSHYFDSVGPGQGRGTDLDLAAGSASPGWYREDSVQSILWGLYDRHGFGPFHQTLTGPLRTTPAVTSIHAFAAAYGAVLPAARADLSAALVSQSISGVTDDPWGQQESNSGGLTGVLPLYKPVGIGVPTVACVSNAAGNYNKLGSFVYLRANVQAARNYQITVTGPGNADPDFTVYSGARLAASEGPGSSESAAVSLPMGEVVVALTDANDSSSNTCFNVTIQ
jgi:hypothetical protein